MVRPIGNIKAILLSLIVEPNDDGYLARCPGIQGAFAEGDTIEEAVFNCVDVIKLLLDELRAAGFRMSEELLSSFDF